jgi:cyanophycinase-like exopeptidase
MVNIALSTYNFNNEICFPHLVEFLHPNMQVCIMPFSHDDILYEDYAKFDYVYDYDDPNSDFQAIARAFRDYGIEKIRIIHPKDNLDMMFDKIIKSDILFFTGGNPVKAMERMQEIIPMIELFDGIVMGASAGAMVQVEEFVIDGEGYPYSYYKGLGFIPSTDIIVHYKKDDEHLMKIMQRSSEERPMTKLFGVEDGDCLIFI